MRMRMGSERGRGGMDVTCVPVVIMCGRLSETDRKEDTARKGSHVALIGLADRGAPLYRILIGDGGPAGWAAPQSENRASIAEAVSNNLVCI